MIVKINQIDVGRWKVRQALNGQPFDELRASIAENGLVVPLACREVNGKFELVCGHRRIAALNALGKTEVEIDVHDWNDEACMIASLAENVQRQNLTSEEEGRAYMRLKSDYQYSNNDVASRMGISKSRVHQLIRYIDELDGMEVHLVETPTEKVVRAVRESGVDDKYREHIIKKAVDEGLTSAQVTKVAKTVAKVIDPKAKQKMIDRPFSAVLHDPERMPDHAQQQKRRSGVRDDIVDWTPEVASVLEVWNLYPGHWNDVMESITKDKWAPEALEFFLGKRLRPAMKAMNDLEQFVLGIMGESDAR